MNIEENKKLKVKWKKSDLDYMITYGINKLNFTLLEKKDIIDLRALRLEFDNEKKLCLVKEIIILYIIDIYKLDDIYNK